ncbi:MAG: hypothetical protein ACOX71_01380 [Lachnospiraceae bacterium]|jgi:hypothetical protein
MKRYNLLFLTVIFVLFLSGCGSSRVDETTVTIKKNFSIEAAYVSDFDEEVYNSYLLEKEVKELVSEYNTKAESKNVSLKSLDVENNKAYAVFEFSSSDDYSRFNNEEMYAGLFSDALESGKVGSDRDVLTLDGKLSMTLGQAMSDKNASKYKICAITGQCVLVVKGKPVYKTEGITINESGEIRVDSEDTAYLIYE